MNANDVKKVIGTETADGETVTAETLAELSNGKGDGDNE